MELLADESVDFGIVKELRSRNIIIHSIAEDSPGIPDMQVLQIALDKSCVLLTEDKDFGELTYRLKLPHKGIVLIRLSDLPRQERIQYAADMIEKFMDKLNDHFSVLSARGLRIKESIHI